MTVRIGAGCIASFSNPKYKPMTQQLNNNSAQQRNIIIRRLHVGDWQLELLPREPYEARYTPIQSIIGFSFDTQFGTHAFASDRKKGFRAKPNGLAYVPAGCDVYSQSSDGGEYLKVLYSGVHERQWQHERRFSDLIDVSAIGAAFTIRRALLSNETVCLQECEHSLMVLEACVANTLGDSRKFYDGSSRLTIKQLKQVDDFIEAHIDAQLTVSEIAFEFKLSSAYFSREFKKAVGRSPHQYIVDKRLQLARKLLQQSQQELISIAYACGFSSHSHMTRQFRVRLGFTPSQLRRGYVTKFSH